MADADEKYNQEVLVKISELYAPYLSMGFIQVNILYYFYKIGLYIETTKGTSTSKKL